MGKLAGMDNQVETPVWWKRNPLQATPYGFSWWVPDIHLGKHAPQNGRGQTDLLIFFHRGTPLFSPCIVVSLFSSNELLREKRELAGCEVTSVYAG